MMTVMRRCGRVQQHGGLVHARAGNRDVRQAVAVDVADRDGQDGGVCAKSCLSAKVGVDAPAAVVFNRIDTLAVASP